MTLRIIPANEAQWEDLRTVFGAKGYAADCQCQRFKVGPAQWSGTTLPERMRLLQKQTHCGNPAAATSGLIAYLGDEPVGWCAVEPRSEYNRLPPARTVFKARGEDATDPGVWAVTCFATRAGFRRQGISRALALAAVKYARQRGARAVEAYPMISKPGVDITWGESHVGTRSIFAAAGLREVAHPTIRRVVMRLDFGA